MNSDMPPGTEYSYGNARVRIYSTRRKMGLAAAEDAAAHIRKTVEERGLARIMIATGNSQLDVIDSLVKQPTVPWKLTEIFHMDEYLGLAADHPASFRRWIRERVEEPLHGVRVNYIEGDAPDPEVEMRRYTQLLRSGPIDLAFVGFGENGHIAFNDPPMADFEDPCMMRRVTLDEACRRQQVGEGHFHTLADVPAEALTVSCSGLLRARAWICCVPEQRKAQAVHRALLGEISTECPASIVRTHANAKVYLDPESASVLLQQEVASRT
ncbi:MAG TPA: glucosamine-6-phosphate deaminase [Terracidiphilus sp.]|nr:glucosamine-6-phosphate deaminase [Terracidiphilus sp.]